MVRAWGGRRGSERWSWRVRRGGRGWLCGGSLDKGLGPVTEVGYNALHNRLGVAMTNTQRLTEQNRPAGSNNLFVAWETLTHGDNPN